MRTTHVSSLVYYTTPMNTTARIQNELTRLNKEVSTGRMSDVGLSLGAETGRSMSLHIDASALDAFTASNATVSARLSHTDTALTSLNGGITGFLASLVSARDSGTAGGTIAQAAADALGSFASALNTTSEGDYVFAGINSGAAPIADFDAGPRAAIVAAFTARFGFAPTDPAAASIDAASMTDFLDNGFAGLFDDANWAATWSSASSDVMLARISPGETIPASVSANDPAFRQLAMTYAMVAVLGGGGLGAAAQQALIDKALVTGGNAQTALTTVQASVGTMENRVAAANARLSTQKDILSTRIDSLEGVDPAAAKTRIDMLSTQLEMSYSLTAKLLQLSIINYV